MIDPEDNRTQNLPEFAEAQAVLARVKSAEQAERDEKEAFLRDSHALVRVKTPVFIEDPKLAKELRAKALAAARSADYREKKKAESGLVLSMTPIDVVEQVKRMGWTDFLKTKELVKTITVEVPVQVIKTVEVIKEIPVEIIKTVEIIKEVRIDVPGKPVLKLSAEQKKTFLLGQKVLNLTGFKRFLVQKIVGFRSFSGGS